MALRLGEDAGRLGEPISNRPPLIVLQQAIELFGADDLAVSSDSVDYGGSWFNGGRFPSR